MVSGLNLNNLTVDPKTGQVSFSGLTSGIDFQSVVGAIIKARQIPIDSLNADITGRKDKIAAFNDLKTLLSALKQSISKLYGAVSFGNVNDDFQARSVYASTMRSDGQAPADAASLLNVTADNSAAIANHTLEVMRVATAHKISTTSVSSATGTLGSLLGLTDGSFDLNGRTIDVFASDSLQDVRDRINAANKGSNATHVSATIVSVSATQNVLVLSSDKTGAANEMTIANETGGVLASLGLSNDGGATFVTELQQGLDARLKADGLKDADRWESNTLVSQTATLSNYISTASATGTFDITIGATTHTISYNGATDTLQTLRDSINTAFGSTVASIDSDPTGYRLVVDGAGSTVTTSDTSGLLTDLGFDNDQVVTRTSNNITDLFAGITLSLFNAQEGTTVKLDVSQDLTKPQADIKAFVEAYNAVRQFINEQNARDTTTGEKSSGAGPLFASPTLGNIQSQLARILGTGVEGVDAAFSALAQIGVDFVDNNNLSDPTLANTLEIDSTKLANALINNPEDVRRLFSFELSSSSSKLTLLSFTGNTQYSQAGHTVNVQYEKSYDSTDFNLNTETASSPMSDYLTLTDGSFEIHNSGGLVGTISYTAGESLDALAADIDALAGINSDVVFDGEEFHLEIKSDTNEALTFQGDTGGLIAALGIANRGDKVFSANIDGATDGSDDGSATVNGSTITATDQTGADGLMLFYNGTSDLSGATVDYTVGLASQINFAIDDILADDGLIESELTNLDGQNDLANDRINEMQLRLDMQREALLARFRRMETTLATAQNIMDSLKQTVDAAFNNNNNR